MLGRVRFLALYLLSGLVGSAAVFWLSDPSSVTVGASGAIFGLMAALLVVAVKVRGDVQGLLVLVAVNVVITVFGAGFISWQGHLGGFVGGLRARRGPGLRAARAPDGVAGRLRVGCAGGVGRDRCAAVAGPRDGGPGLTGGAPVGQDRHARSPSRVTSRGDVTRCRLSRPSSFHIGDNSCGELQRCDLPTAHSTAVDCMLREMPAPGRAETFPGLVQTAAHTSADSAPGRTPDRRSAQCRLGGGHSQWVA